MDFDNILYILIAVVLGIVNAVASKKKKANEAAKSPKPASNPQDHYEDGYSEEEFPEVEQYAPKASPLEILFGNQVEPEPEVETSPLGEPIDSIEYDKEPVKEPEMTSFQQKMQERAKDFVDFKHEVNSFDFEEDGIAKSGIGNALTEEEEEELMVQQEHDSLAYRFDVTDAIVYSEIINPKYFKIGVNS